MALIHHLNECWITFFEEIHLQMSSAKFGWFCLRAYHICDLKGINSSRVITQTSFSQIIFIKVMDKSERIFGSFMNSKSIKYHLSRCCTFKSAGQCYYGKRSYKGSQRLAHAVCITSLGNIILGISAESCAYYVSTMYEDLIFII